MENISKNHRKNCPNVKLLLIPSQIEITKAPSIITILNIMSAHPMTLAPLNNSFSLGTSTSRASFGAEEKSFISWTNATADISISVIDAQNTIARKIVNSISCQSFPRF